MSEINLIEEELWDHYSGLPNPLWYQYKKQLEDEEEAAGDLVADRIIDGSI
jgi:hypothetical protein